MAIPFLRTRQTSFLTRAFTTPHHHHHHHSIPIRRSFSTTLRRFIQVVRPSPAELSARRLDERSLEAAVRGLHVDGLVVVEDVVPHGALDRLNARMVDDAYSLQARGEDGPFNYNLGNLQQDAPPWAEFFWPEIFVNSIATQITSSVLGPLPKWTFCSANSAMPPLAGSDPSRQPVHSDADFAHPSHPFALVVNVPLVDMTPRNGSTEVWPGTHATSSLASQEGMHGDRASGRIRDDVLEDWVASSSSSGGNGNDNGNRGPQQPTIKKGSIVVRDLRLWHAGMPNYTDEVRVMLAMIHFASWYRNPMRLELADDIRPLLRELEEKGELGLDVRAVDWVWKEDVEARYLGRGFGNSYDFNQAP